MQKYDLPVSNDNVLNTYKENSLKRNEHLFAFVELLLSIKEDYTIAVDGRWGSGKTFFIKQLEMILKASNSNIESEYSEEHETILAMLPKTVKMDLENALLLPIYYDAWKNDNDDDPVLSLIYNIINTLDTYNTLKESNLNLTKVIKEIVQKFIPLDIEKITDDTDILSEITSKKDVEIKIKEFFANILSERGNKLIILIDELDRCRPCFAVKMLERIKHYFNNENIIFVFSVNIAELQYTINNVYGNNFNSGRYLDRFFDFRVSLPPVNAEDYLSKNIKGGWISDVVNIVSSELNLQMRELCKYRIYVELLVEKRGKLDYRYENDPVIVFIYYALLPIAYIYKLTNMNLYYDFINGNHPNLLLDIFVKRDILKDFCELSLLESNETFSNEDTTKDLIDLETRIIQIYQYICKMPVSNYRGIKLGKMRITNEHTSNFKKMLTLIK